MVRLLFEQVDPIRYQVVAGTAPVVYTREVAPEPLVTLDQGPVLELPICHCSVIPFKGRFGSVAVRTVVVPAHNGAAAVNGGVVTLGASGVPLQLRMASNPKHAVAPSAPVEVVLPDDPYILPFLAVTEN